MVHESGVCPVLIGRRAELAALRGCMEQVQSGKGQVALLCGEAGIGKSRLMSELKAEALAQGFQALQGQCFPADPSCPHAPLLDLLRARLLHAPADHPASDLAPFARELTPLLPEVSQLFPELTTLSPLPTLEPEQEKRRLFAALARFFFQQAATRPVLLIIEDVHWSDETSLDFLHYLARHGTAQPLLLLLTYRSEELDPSLGSFLAELDRAHLAREVVLRRLTRSETDAMVRAMFELPPPWQVAMLHTIYELTEGDPFFIEELLKSLVAAGERANTPDSWEHTSLGAWQVPRSIQVAVKLRADQVSPAARQVLHLAAVAGRRFDFAVLQQITHADEHQLLTLMKELLAAQLVVEETTDHFTFRHALTRQAIYADLLGRERHTLHRTIAETMEQLYHAELSAHLADLASHFAEAGVWEKALEYAQRAGEQAQQCLEITQEIEHRQWMTSAHWAFGLLYRDLLSLSLAQQHLEHALALAQEIGSPVWTRLASGPLALVWLAQHDVPRAEWLLNAAPSLDGPPHTLTQRLIWYGRAHLALAQRKPDRALAIIDELMESAVNRANEQSLPHLAHTRGVALMRLHRLAEAEVSLQAALAGAMTQGLRPLLWRIAIDLGNLYRAQRRDEEALRAFTTAQELIAALAAPIPDTSLREHFLQQAMALIPRQAPLAPRREESVRWTHRTRTRGGSPDRAGQSQSGDRRGAGRQLPDD